jgi:hypothetical protein
MYEHNRVDEITGPLIRTEVPVGFIFDEQPEDDPSLVLKNSTSFINYSGERTLALDSRA